MTAIIKKIKVGLSQEEIDDLKPFNGTYDGDINAKGFIRIQNKHITFGGAKSDSVMVSFKNGSRNGNSSEELAFLSDLVGSGVAQSVIDLGTITEDPASATNSVLSEIFSTGIYKFEYEYTSAPGITSQAYLMYVFNKYGTLCQNIICSGNHIIQRMYRGDEGWIIEERSFATRDEMLIASKQTTATNTSNKIFLIGSTSQSSIGTSTYSHDTVYIDTDGHLYDSGKRVLTTADNVSGGAVSGEQIAIQEIFSNSTYTYKTDFDWSKLTLDNFDEYCVRFLRFNGGNHEILKPEKVFASSIGNTYYFENTVIGIKVVMSSTGTATISTYIPNNEGIPTSLAAFSSASAGIYGTTLTSGLYSFNCLLDDGSYLNFTMDLNQDASYTQVSPIIKDWGEGAFERLSYYKGTLKYVDQDGQPLSSYNTIQIRRLYSY